MAKIVFPLHGIRTLGNWQRTFADQAKRRGWTCPLDGWWFGRFSLLQFLTPFARSAKVAWFRERYTTSLREYQRTIDGRQDRRPSIVGHSFGTYIIGYAMMKYKDIRFDKIVLCGSILPRSFPWDALIERGQVNVVRNDIGLQDFWASACSWVVPGTGSAGSRGFTREHERLVQHRHNLNHGEFFDALWMDEHWMTFLEQSFPPVERPADTSGAVTIPRGDHPIASRFISGLLTFGCVAALVLLAWLLVGLVVPGPEPSYRLVDAARNEPIEREYTLRFRQGETTVEARGSAARPVQMRGKKPRPGEVFCECEGYEYSAGDQTRMDEGVIRLKRKPGLARFPGTFLSTIRLTVPEDDASVHKPSPSEYAPSLGHEELRELRLSVSNSTPYHLILVLYRWSPDPPTPENFWTRWTYLSECPPGAGNPKDYTIFDFKPGAYYFIYGTILGRAAQYLAQGDLRGPGTATLQVRMKDVADRRLEASPLVHRWNPSDNGEGHSR